jgi:hypothetical protein
MNDLFLQGVVEFNRRNFFEAHDVWEELWCDTRDERRLFFQGLIQTAVGFYHLSNNNVKGATSQLEKGLQKLNHYPTLYHGIKLEQLREQTRLCREQAEALRRQEKPIFDERQIPVIEFE